jgi:hypothetical protein
MKLPEELLSEIVANSPTQETAAAAVETQEQKADITVSAETAATEETKIDETETAKETVIVDEASKEEGKEQEVATNDEDKEFDDYLDTIIPNSAKVSGEDKAEVKSEEGKEVKTDSVNTERYKALEEMLENPTAKWMLEQLSQGKDLIEEVSRVATTNPDTLSPVELYKAQIEELKSKRNLTDEQVEDYIERFEDKDPIEQEQLVSSYRDKLVNDWKKTRESLAPSIDPVAAQKQQEEYWENVNKKANDEFVAFKSSAKEKGFYGLEWTDERLSTVEKKLFNGDPEAIVVYRQDGTVDIPASVEHTSLKLYIRDIIKSAVTKTKNSTKNETLRERHNTQADTNSRQPSTKTLDPVEAYLEALNAKKI